MKARFAYNIAIQVKHTLDKNRTVTLYGTVEGFDQLDALENARWLYPQATKIVVVTDKALLAKVQA